jgi:hypothetical protein
VRSRGAPVSYSTESPSCVGALPRHKLMVSQSSGMILGKPISSKEKLFHD